MYLAGADVGDVELAARLLLLSEEAQGRDAVGGGVVGDEEQRLLQERAA